jgi:hypothetical protein
MTNGGFDQQEFDDQLAQAHQTRKNRENRKALNLGKKKDVRKIGRNEIESIKKDPQQNLDNMKDQIKETGLNLGF